MRGSIGSRLFGPALLPGVAYTSMIVRAGLGELCALGEENQFAFSIFGLSTKVRSVKAMVFLETTFNCFHTLLLMILLELLNKN